MKIKQQKCKCGCGQLTSGEYNYELKKYPSFVNYHQGKLYKKLYKGKHYSPKTEFKSGNSHPNYGKISCRKGKSYKELFNDETSQQIKKAVSLAHKNKFEINISKNILKKEYIDKKQSSVIIAKKYKTTSSTILNRLRFFNIKIRNMSEMQTGELNHAYGKSSWNKDLTKENNEKMKQISVSMKGINKGGHPKCEFKKGYNNGRKGKKIEEIYGEEESRFIRKKMRISRLNYVSEKYNNGEPIHPCVGKQEKPILDNLEKQFNYPILRQYNVDGYWLDGYCPSLNIAIEVDESHHNNPKVKKHDEEKEKYIQEKLKCEFLRLRC